MKRLALCLFLAFACAGSSAAAAAADGSFLIPERSVGAVAVRPDGNVVVAGRTGERLAASQAPRPCRGCRVYLAEFDLGGQLVRGFGGEWPGRWIGGVRAIVLGPEGDVYLAGKSNGGARIARFDQDGHLDAGFGTRGIVKFQEVGDRVLPTFEGLAIEPDGTVVAAGTARTVDGLSETLLLRFEPDGNLDPSFGNGGVVLTGASPGHRLGPKSVEAVTVTADGRIVVAGGTKHLYKQRSALFAARYLSDGELDPSFGTRGQRAVGATHTGSLGVQSLGVLGDGTVVMAGQDFFALPGTVDMCRKPLIARLLSDGTPDPGFGGINGQEPGLLDAGPRVGSPCGNEAATVLGDGSTAFTLFDREESSIFPGRLAPDGSRAPGFASPSSALTPPPGAFFWHFKLAPGGEIEAGEVATPFPGGSHGPFFHHSVIIVARRADGQLRRGFGTDGTVVFPPDAR